MRPAEDAVAVLADPQDGTEGNWRRHRPTLRELLDDGYVRVGTADADERRDARSSYLTGRRFAEDRDGRDRDHRARPMTASVDRRLRRRARRSLPTTVWNRPSHDAGEYGTQLCSSASCPAARFRSRSRSTRSRTRCASSSAASPTQWSSTSSPALGRRHTPSRASTTGRRASPVDPRHEQRGVGGRGRGATAQGFRDGDAEWEALGIFEHITRPRITAAITGLTPDGEADQGRLQVHRRVPDGRRLRGERRVPGVDIPGRWPSGA